MSLSERLELLHELHVRGRLTDAEFTTAKARVIAEAGEAVSASTNAVIPTPPPPPVPPLPPPVRPKTLHPVVPGVGIALAAGAAGT